MLSISGKTPAEGEKNVDLDTTIEFSIIDDGTGIDISTLIVEVNGARAYDGSGFGTGYDGAFSEVTPDGDDYTVVIDREADFLQSLVVGVQVQVKSVDEDYLNDLWAFKTVLAEPQLTDNSPSQDEELDQPQLIHLEFEDLIDGVDLTSIDISINGLGYIVSGTIQTEWNGALSSISATDDGVIVRIDPLESLKKGAYTVQYSVADSNSNFLNGVLDFSVVKNLTLPSDIKQIGFTGFFQGIKKTSDLGCGDSIRVEWHNPIVRSVNYESFLLLYKNESRLSTFDGDPSYIAPSTVTQGDISGLIPGDTISYGVRAMEATLDVWDLSGMQEMDDGLYIIPGRASVSISATETDLRIEVDSTSGWPESGLIKIGNEVMRYTSILSDSDTFVIHDDGRGLFGSTAGVYVEGDEVSLFVACQDNNSVILMATPSYHDGYQSGREINSTGIIVPDFSDNDSKVFQGFDFCGYHHPLPQQVLQNEKCGSYLGGEHNGWRGMDLYDRMLNREEVLLDQTGEPIILLRRIWDGEKCSCAHTRRDHPKLKSCAECFGTTYVGGYSQFLNQRRADKRIMMSFKEAPEDLKHGDHEQLQQEFEPGAWTLPMPAIKDRDVLVRFDFTDDIEYIYEVLDSSREKILYRHFGRQNLKLKRMDKTDILYTLIKSAIIDNTLLPTIE
jgi:methionine-rich copper-binding protein CopC